MKLYIDFQEMTRIFDRAADQGRYQLFEHETYDLLRALGSESVPEHLLFARDLRLTSDLLAPFPGRKVVLKIVSPDVVHKSDMGGVKVVSRLAGKVRSESRRMVDRVSDGFAAFVETHPDQVPEPFKALAGRTLRVAVNQRIQGVLITEYLPPESDALGNELLVSLRWTREFGMVITAGLGGIDTELFAERLRPGQAVVSASTALVTAQTFFELFQKTLAYEKLSGQTRGGRRLVSDEQIIECFGAFIAVGNHFSPLTPGVCHTIQELEVNPFALKDYEMVPLDGLCRFAKPAIPSTPRSIEGIDSLLHPRSVAILGVSATQVNFGRHILQNMVQAGFPKEKITLVSSTVKEIDGIACERDLTCLPPVDLLVIAVGAKQVPALVEDIIDNHRAKSVILIPGGLGEKEGTRTMARAMAAKIHHAHCLDKTAPLFLGGNCLGIISRPGRVDTFFAPEACCPKRRHAPPSKTALICQSGAFALVRMTALVSGDPAYTVTVGNQSDLTIGDFITWMADAEEIAIICVYVEGFNDLDGLHACRGIRRAVKRGKQIVVYKAGRTPEGKKATSGHTASVAGDYMVCTSCLGQAGALVTDSLEEFDGLMNLSAFLHGKKITGNRIGGLSSAGFETVGIADSLQSRDSCLELARFEPETQKTLATLFDRAGLTEIMDIKNPLDITPGAPDRVHVGAVKAMIHDTNIDAVVLSLGSLAPATGDTPDLDDPSGFTTTPGSLATLLPDIAAASPKPVVVFNDAGQAHDPINNHLRSQGIPVFSTCSQTMVLLARYIAYRLGLESLIENEQNAQ